MCKEDPVTGGHWTYNKFGNLIMASVIWFGPTDLAIILIGRIPVGKMRAQNSASIFNAPVSWLQLCIRWADLTRSYLIEIFIGSGFGNERK